MLGSQAAGLGVGKSTPSPAPSSVRARFALMLYVLTMLTASCTVVQDSPEAPASDDGMPVAPLAVASIPPTDIPQASMTAAAGSTVIGSVVYAAWITNGKLVEEEADGVADLESFEPIGNRLLEIAIGSTVSPAFAHSLTYTSIGKNGLPIDNGTRRPCVKHGEDPDACTYFTQRGSMVFRVVRDPATTLIVLNLAWYVPESLREAGNLPTEVSASWAFAIKE